jgi:hypothetical protein
MDIYLYDYIINHSKASKINIHLLKMLSTIQKRHGKIRDTIARLSEDTPMLPGCFGAVSVKCGKDYCWCATSDKGHLYYRITWTENGKSRTKLIPDDDIPWIKEVTQNYRHFRKMRRELKGLQLKLKIDFDKWERRLIRKTRRLRTYLRNL